MDNPFDEFGNPIEIARIIWDTDAFTAALGKAESGDGDAQFRLGMMYLEDGNRFVDKDYAEAAEWLGKAAAQGHGEARKELDRLKSEGEGEAVNNEIDYDEKFDEDFRALFTERLKEDKNFGCELWSALANVSWIHTADPAGAHCGHSFRGAGSLIASMLGEGDYVDWYCCGPYETVSEYIAERMASKGWRYELFGGEPGP